MRITLVISSLSNGGSERSMSTLASYWAEKGWPVTLLTLDDGTQPPFFTPHPAIEWRPLGIDGIYGGGVRALGRNSRRLRVLHRAIRESRPQVVLSFVDRTNVVTLLAGCGLQVPVIISDRVSPVHWPIGGIGWRSLRRVLYPRAACLVLQTSAALRYYPPSIRRLACVIPNPAIPRGTTTPDPAQPRKPLVIAMGRLTGQKGFDLLLKAFARVAPGHPTWSLEIWGDGPARRSLEALRDALGLQGRATLPGITHEPAERMAAASLFVLSSRFEGFPNVLCEALACGLPAVSFACPDGPSEIIRHGVDGLLVPPEDLAGLTAALDRLMTSDDERQRLAMRAPEVIERFGQERVMRIWETVIQRVVGDAGRHPVGPGWLEPVSG